MNTALIAALLLSPSVGATTSTHAKGSGIKCSLQKVVDGESSNLVALTYLLPGGWTSKSAFHWPHPGEWNATVYAQTTDHAYTMMRIERFVSSYNQFRNTPPVGDKQGAFIQGVEIHHATDALRYLASRTMGTVNAQNVEEVAANDTQIPPEKLKPWNRVAPNDPMTEHSAVTEVGFLALTYVLNGRPMVAEFGTTVVGQNSIKHMPNRPDDVVVHGGVFTIGPTTVCIFPAKSDPKRLKELQVIATSINQTPKFTFYDVNLTMRLARLALGANAAELRADQSTFHERSMAQFRHQMDMKDAYSHQFCNYISSQQDYRDQKGQIATLPANFKYVWDDGNGSFYLTDDATTDLRGVGSGNWKESAKARPGD